MDQFDSFIYISFYFRKFKKFFNRGNVRKSLLMAFSIEMILLPNFILSRNTSMCFIIVLFVFLRVPVTVFF